MSKNNPTKHYRPPAEPIPPRAGPLALLWPVALLAGLLLDRLTGRWRCLACAELDDPG